MDDQNVTKWITHATAGDELAAEQIFNYYYERLVGLARQKLRAVPAPIADDEGAVVSAFRSFFSGVEAGEFAKLQGRDDLWKLLATMTARKAIAQIRRHWRKTGEADRMDRAAEVAEHLDRSLTPAEITAFVEDCERRIESLEEPTLKQIALLRLEGYETREIAEQLEVHQRTVQRKIALIQGVWLESEPADDDK